MLTSWKTIGPALALAWLAGCATPSGDPAPGKPEHHTRDGFRNLHIPRKDGSPFGYWRMRYFGDDDWAPYEGQGGRVPRAVPQVAAGATGVPRVTWLGHATVLIEYLGTTVLTDPMLTERASPLSFAGPLRVTPPALSLAELPPIDYVVISHNHYDHLDRPSAEAIGNRATWLVPLGYRELLARWGIDKVVELDWWQSHEEGLVSITATPGQHWTARGLFDRYRALWAGWSIRIGDFKAYYAGDTGYNDTQFKEIGDRLGPFDLGLIPIGGYRPRWFMRDMHVEPEESVRIHQDVRARLSIGVAWGAFPLTAEPIDEPPRLLAEAATHLIGSRFITVKLGETVSVVPATE